MNYRFLPEVSADLLSAADYYEAQRTGLGSEFIDDLELALSRVLEAPNRWPELEPGVRRYRFDRFPYALIYRMPAGDMVEIVAVFHLHRRPGSWRLK